MIVNGKRRTGRRPVRDTGRDQLPVPVLDENPAPDQERVPNQHRQVVSSLLARFPEFAQSAFVEGAEVDLPYVFLGHFGLYVRDGLVERTLSPEELRRVFDFLNELGDNRDTEVQNLLQVGMLEILLDHEVSVAVARARLKGGALELFEEIFRFWKGDQTG